MSTAYIAAELKTLQSEMKSMRRLLKGICEKLEGDATLRAQWKDKKVALEELGITERQLSHRATQCPDIKRNMPGVGVQVNVALYKATFNN